MSEENMTPIGKRLVTLPTAPFVEIRFVQSDEGDAYLTVLQADGQWFRREIDVRELERFAQSILDDLGKPDSLAEVIEST